MAGNLEATINSSVKVIRVSALTPPLSGALLRIEDELLAFRSVKRLDTPPFRPNEDGDWNVDRGVAGTTAASHAEDSEVVYAFPVYGDEPIDQAGGSGLPAEMLAEVNETWGPTIRPTDETAGTLVYLWGDPAGLNITLGNFFENEGGDISLALYVYDGESNTAGIEISTRNGGEMVLTAVTSLKVSGLPTSDPGVAGQLYTAGAPGAGDPKALMVSGGAAP